MKRPAAGVLKRPAKQAKTEENMEPPPLTEKAVKEHEKFLQEMAKKKDLSQEDFDQALAKLPANTSQMLWKAFEANRKETGTEGEYKEASSGTGQMKKKRALLRGWCMDKGQPGDCYRKMLTSVSLTKKSGLDTKWLTKQEALQKWGKDELSDRLQKGTIQARRNPLDKSYWEFKAIVQKESTFATKNKETNYSTGWKEVGQKRMSFIMSYIYTFVLKDMKTECTFSEQIVWTVEMAG